VRVAQLLRRRDSRRRSSQSPEALRYGARVRHSANGCPSMSHTPFAMNRLSPGHSAVAETLDRRLGRTSTRIGSFPAGTGLLRAAARGPPGDAHCPAGTAPFTASRSNHPGEWTQIPLTLGRSPPDAPECELVLSLFPVRTAVWPALSAGAAASFRALREQPEMHGALVGQHGMRGALRETRRADDRSLLSAESASKRFQAGGGLLGPISRNPARWAPSSRRSSLAGHHAFSANRVWHADWGSTHPTGQAQPSLYVLPVCASNLQIAPFPPSLDEAALPSRLSPATSRELSSLDCR
jgi:hypothetical protein